MKDHLGAAELLRQLALDLRWSWNHATDELWGQLEPDLWSRTHNPWVVLGTVSPTRLTAMLEDGKFRAQIDRLIDESRRYTQPDAWFQQTHPHSALTRVAYFSMEFMLSEALPIYAGGLGNVAGDHLKAASDLGVPVIGLGLLYQQGYFRQVIDSDGRQQAFFPYNDPGQLPVQPLRRANGEWLRIELRFPGGRSLWLRTWQVVVGRTRLYLLDSNDAANHPSHRSITSELYGGGPELRLQQEIVLGIGGWRLLEELQLLPEVCHLNEGHAGLLILERARTLMQRTGQSFSAALASTRAGNLFTTHTAVPAGFDRFSAELMERYLGRYALEQLHLSAQELLALGRARPEDPSEPFNMAYLAVRGSTAVNAVSRLHGEVSCRIFEPLFPRWPAEEIPVGYVTNGIHTPSWDSSYADDLWTSVAGKARWSGNLENLGGKIRSQLSDRAVWDCRTAARGALIDYARDRLALQLTNAGAPAEEVESARHSFRPDILTLGFARRFATYKRPNLLLQDTERLLRLLTHPTQPVQLIIAGKAHPADEPGQALISEWVHFVRRPDVRAHAVFLEDYDMLLTERLVQGVDVWLNTPRRPWEACGTSGMKVLVNGGLNLSELDGWWAEAYTPEVGWALGDGREHGEDSGWDHAEAAQLFELLEQQVVPSFYQRDPQGVPRAWVARVRESMARLTPQYSANRSVRDYLEKYYLPAAASYRARTDHDAELGRQIAEWQAALQYHWAALRFESVNVTSTTTQHRFVARVQLGALRPQFVRLELFADPVSSFPAVREPMALNDSGGDAGSHTYIGSVPATRPVSDFTVRVVPNYPGAKIPLEASGAMAALVDHGGERVTGTQCQLCARLSSKFTSCA